MADRDVDTPVSTDYVQLYRSSSNREFKFLAPLSGLMASIAETVSAVKTFTAAQIFGASFSVDTGTKTATASAGAATLAKLQGVVTTESLTTAQNAIYTLVLTNTTVAVADTVLVTVGNGTNSAGSPVLGTVTVTSNTITILVHNKHASAVAFNGTLLIQFLIVKA